MNAWVGRTLRVSRKACDQLRIRTAPPRLGGTPRPTRQRIVRDSIRLSALLLLLATPASAHPVHTSLAEADYRPDTATLEIAVRVFADDFATALAAHAGRKISLEHTPPAELDLLIQAYLAATFTVRSADGVAQPLHWVGREFDHADRAAQRLWLYFTAPLPGGPADARLRHALLRETFRSQLNSLHLRVHPPAGSPGRVRTATLLFYPDPGEQRVALPPS